jgi:putative ABC transport system permease protein
VRHAIRQLAKNPGFTAVALATLALGIGVNTSAFTLLNRLMLQSLPYRNSSRLVQVWFTSKQQAFISQGSGDYMDEKEQNSVFEDMAAYNFTSRASLADTGQAPIQRGAVFMSANFFAIMGVQPQLGRLFTADEAKRFEWVTLLGHAFWREHYGSDPKVLGRTIKVNGRAYTIIGVMPPALDDPLLFDGQTAVFPLDPFTQADRENRHGRAWYRVVGRLKAGATLEQAQAEMTVVAQRLAHDHPKTNADLGLKVVPFPRSPVADDDARLFWLASALSGFVLAIACANLANLQIVRTTRRAQEIGVRLALGCTRARLMGMLLVDSLLVSVAGGALGLLVALWSNAYLARFFQVDMALDLRVAGFAFVVSLATGAVFGTVPAWMAARADVAASLKAGARGMTSDRSRHRLRQGLVVAELALALTMLAGAGFFVSGIFRVTHQDLGWKADNVIIGYVELDHDHFGEKLDPRSLEYARVAGARLRALPGVEAVQFGAASPLSGFQGSPIRIEGQPVPEPGKAISVSESVATPDFFQVYGIRLVQGRNFRDSDGPGAPHVVIISESLARKAWPGESAIGKRIGTADPAKPDWAEVVGVMADYRGAADFYNPSATRLRLLRPFAQNNQRFVSFNIRTSGPPAPMKETVRKAMGMVTPDIALSALSTAREVMDDEVAFFAFFRRMLLHISVLGLLLASVGVYGVVAALVSERTKEVGIRMALGARPAGLVWLFLKNGLRLSIIGAAVGLGASYLLLKLLERMLPALPGRDLGVTAGIAFLLVGIALLASWLPARRATKTDPLVALRAE